MNHKIMEIIIRSGGAIGADSAWYDYFKDDAAVDFRIVSYPGMKIHHSLENCKVEMIEPKSEKWMYATRAVQEASRCLNVKYSFSPYLLRDYYQIKDAEAVYAIGKKNPNRKGVGIDGGTGYSCQMYVNQKKHGDLFLYNMETLSWEYWKKEWQPLDGPPILPVAYNVVACIGSREFKGKIKTILTI